MYKKMLFKKIGKLTSMYWSGPPSSALHLAASRTTSIRAYRVG